MSWWSIFYESRFDLPLDFFLTSGFIHFSCADSADITNFSAKAYQSGLSAIVQFSCCAYGSPAPILAWKVTSHTEVDNTRTVTHRHLSTCLQVNVTVDNPSPEDMVDVNCSAELPYQQCSKPGEQYCKENIRFKTEESVSAVIFGKFVIIITDLVTSHSRPLLKDSACHKLWEVYPPILQIKSSERPQSPAINSLGVDLDLSFMGINIVQNLHMNRKLTRLSSVSLAGMLM